MWPTSPGRHARGLSAQRDAIDMTDVHAFKAAVVNRFHAGLGNLLKANAITVIHRYGRLVGPDAIEVGDQIIHAESIVLATGSQPRTLPDVPIG